MPRNWRNFLRHSTNKSELFNFLADKVVEHNFDNRVIITKGPDAKSNHIDVNLSNISPCNHEEADTRIFLHAKDAVESGFKTIMINANDTDVLVLAVALFSSLKEVGLQELWLAFGQGRFLKWIPVHQLATSLSPEKSQGILFFHAFTGCDIVSAFRGKGKRSAWQTWDVFPDTSEVFRKLSSHPTKVEKEDIKILEKFVVVMYDRSSSTENVDDARLELFAKKQRSYEAIPPTHAALAQHTRRAAYQAACIWSRALECNVGEESPGEWGWKQEGDYWSVLWSTLPPVAQSCQQFTKCQCKTQCRGRCKCFKLNLPCTPMCSCNC